MGSAFICGCFWLSLYLRSSAAPACCGPICGRPRSLPLIDTSRTFRGMPRIAPEIFRKRMLVEGYFERDDVDERAIRDYFTFITSALSLRTYAEPIVHRTRGEGKD